MEQLEQIPEYMIDDLRNHGYSAGKLAAIVVEYGTEAVEELWGTLCTDGGDRITAKRIERIA